MQLLRMSDVFYNFTTTGRVNGPAVAAILGLETIAGLIANVAVLFITLLRKKSWKQPSTIHFTSLILAHLIMVILYLPITVAAIGAEEWIFGETFEEKRATCSFAAFIFWYTVLVITITLAMISFDRFLFIVKPQFYKQYMRPWVALTLTIAIWILAGLLNSTPLFGLGMYEYEPSYGSCLPTWRNVPGYMGLMVTVFLLIFAIIAVTSIWTFCFTRQFIHDQELMQQSNVYQSRKKRLFGIFGAMLIVYVVCFLPSLVTGIITTIVILPDAVYAMDMICFQLITFASPLVQSYFRPEIKDTVVAGIKKSFKIKESDHEKIPSSSKDPS